MTKMKKQKSGKCNFFQALVGAIGKKKNQPSAEDSPMPEPPFASPLDVSANKHPSIEKEPTKPPSPSPQDRNKAAEKAKRKAPVEVPVKALKSTLADLDKVQRETGLTNNEFAYDRLKIRPNKRAPAKYVERIDQRSGSLDCLSEDLVTTVHSASSDKSEKQSIISDDRGKDSSIFHSSGQTTESSINETKHREHDSLSREKPEASENITLKTEEVISNLKASNNSESAVRMSQSAKEVRRLPRTRWDLGENGAGSLKAVSEVNFKQTSNAEISASQNGLNASKRGLRESRRRSSKAERTDSAVENSADDEKTKNNDTGISSSRRASTKIKAKEMITANEINVDDNNRESTKKRKDEKNKGKSKVVITTETSVENGALKGEDKLAESAKNDEDIWTSVDQNENLTSSLKTYSADSSAVYHDGKILNEKTKASEMKCSVKDPVAVPVIPRKTSRKGREVKTGGQHATSDANETGTKGHACVGESVDAADINDFDKTFKKVKKKPSSDVANNVAQESNGSKSCNIDDDERLDSVEQVASKDGNTKSTDIKNVSKKITGGDSLSVKRAESQKRVGIEKPKALLPTSHSRDASTVSSDGKADSENLAGGKKGGETKTVSPPSGEHTAVIVDAGKTSFKAGKEAVNEFGEAFKKIKSKQTVSKDVNDEPSGNIMQSQPTKPESGEVAALVSKDISSLQAESRVDASRRSLRGSQRKVGDGSKPAENGDKKLTSSTTETDKASVDAGVCNSLPDKAKLPPVAKRSGKVQPKPPENEKVGWVEKARRMSKDFGDKRNLTEVKNDEQKLPNEPRIEASEDFERGGARASVKELVKKIQQSSPND